LALTYAAGNQFISSVPARPLRLRKQQEHSQIQPGALGYGKGLTKLDTQLQVFELLNNDCYTFWLIVRDENFAKRFCGTDANTQEQDQG
jgi:hypothetical protein